MAGSRSGISVFPPRVAQYSFRRAAGAVGARDELGRPEHNAGDSCAMVMADGGPRYRIASNCSSIRTGRRWGPGAKIAAPSAVPRSIARLGFGHKATSACTVFKSLRVSGYIVNTFVVADLSNWQQARG